MARQRLEALCSRAEHCTFELREKLRQWQLPPSQADEIIASLCDEKWVDDRRFARAYVSDKVRFGRRGRLYLRRELLLKRVAHEIIDEAISQIDEEMYNANLEYVLKNRLRTNPYLITDYTGRTKLLRHAVSRGYEPALATACLRKIISENEQ